MIKNRYIVLYILLVLYIKYNKSLDIKSYILSSIFNCTTKD